MNETRAGKRRKGEVEVILDIWSVEKEYSVLGKVFWTEDIEIKAMVERFSIVSVPKFIKMMD